jgi:hypothetical protein
VILRGLIPEVLDRAAVEPRRTPSPARKRSSGEAAKMTAGTGGA